MPASAVKKRRGRASVDDGRIPLHRNLVENANRPLVVDRKNWLFADTVAGARASTHLYGLIETAKANGIEPSRYLAHLFQVLQTVTSADQLDALLPQNLDRERLSSSRERMGLVDR